MSDCPDCPQANPVQPPEWPLLLSPFKLMAKPGDKGLGDILARTIGPMGGDAFKKWHKEFSGEDCKCELRQEWLNLNYPL